MNSIKFWQTAQTPSTFGMPISGHSYGVTTGAIDVCAAATTIVVRERAGIAATTGAVKADKGLAPSFLGTTAWRPPTC